MSTRLTAPPPPGTSPSRRRRFAALSALVALTVTGLAVPGRSASAYDEPGPVAGAATTEEPAPRLTLEGVTGEQVVTLVTGDRVRLSPAGGQYAVSPEPGPGRAPRFVTQSGPEGLYVYPDDALAAIQAGRVDQELFNVEYLAENGYADGATSRVPVIAQYPAGRSRTSITTAAQALPASTATRALESIGAAALNVPKSGASTFWAAVRGSSGQARLGAGLGTLWLDRKMTADLDQSVPMIGAPQAWAAGHDGTGVKVAVLDTGIDAEHPDLAGKVAASKSFVPGVSSVADGAGHGTHVASTIGGSGAAAGGKYKGVAPGVQLVIGKVLSDSGSGDMSWIIEGMEWAAASGAKVISMSLGGCCSDGTDPAAQAVNALTAQTGALFVVAAGNNGADETINSPGAADAALTVAAVDKSDHLAGFSSRGPRPGDSAAKPDIAAPGVNIVAARAKGTTMGVPVDEHHTTASGTSMATPHVAGAAALLAGQHPDWTNVQLKAALTSTARDDGYGSYSQGSGRVDVARAVKQQIRADGGIDFGFLASPQKGPVTRTLTYTNDGDQPITLTLRSGITAHRGGNVPSRTLTLDKDTLTVPAHGSAPVAVTFDPTGPDTWYEGFVRAADASGQIQVSTAVGAFVEPKKVTVRTKLVLPDGATSPTLPPWILLRTDDRDDLVYVYYPDSGQESEASIYPGTYSVMTALAWRDTDGTWVQSLPAEPEVEIADDTTVTLDLRKARKVRVDTPREAETYLSHYAIQRAAANGVTSIDGRALYPQYGLGNYAMLPTRKVKQGTFTLAGQFLMGAPAIDIKVHGGPEITPRYVTVRPEARKLAGRARYSLVAAGPDADLAGLDVRGKLVLLDLSDLCPTMQCTGKALDRVKAAQAAGAAGVLGYGAVNRAFLDPAGSWAAYPIPTMSLTAKEGRALAQLAERRPVTVTATGTTATPYVYSLVLPERDRVPSDLHYRLRTRDLQRIENRFHADRPGSVSMSTSTTIKTRLGYFSGLYGLGNIWPSQTAATEYAGPVAPDVVWNRQTTMTYDGAGDYYARRAMTTTSIDVFSRSGTRDEPWGAQPRVPGNAVHPDEVHKAGSAQCFACRTGDLFVSAVPVMGPFPHHQEAFTYSVNFNRDKHGGKDEMHLYRDGQEIPLVEAKAVLGIFAFTVPTFTLPEGEASYRLTDTFHVPYPSQLYARDVETAWTFRSKRPTGGMTDLSDGLCVGWLVVSKLAPCEPVRRLNLRYDLGLDLDNRARAGRSHRISVTGYHGSIDKADARITDLKLSATFDDGATWVPLRTSPSGRATIDHPPLNATKGAVGIRAQATDAEGNTIDQTIHRAYGLK